jgi:hypothetical protein
MTVSHPVKNGTENCLNKWVFFCYKKEEKVVAVLEVGGSISSEPAK